MKCYFHEDRETVATCKRCGKGLCKECASKYTPCLCDSCFSAIQQEKEAQTQRTESDRKRRHIAALVDTRAEFLKTALVGIALGIFLLYIRMQSSDVTGMELGDKIVTLGFALGLGFCLPFGWNFVTYLQSRIGSLQFLYYTETGWGVLAIWMVIKITLTLTLCIPALIYQIVKTFFVQKKIDELKK